MNQMGLREYIDQLQAEGYRVEGGKLDLQLEFEQLYGPGLRDRSPIVGIEYGWAEIHVASPLVYESRAMRGAATPTSFEPEAIEGEESVTVSWSLAVGPGVIP